MEDSNPTENITRRRALKGTAAGIGIAGLAGLPVSAFAQENDPIPATFCGEASLPPVSPPGGQAGQCINCVAAVCEGPVALDPLFNTDDQPDYFDGIDFTIPAAEIPAGADYLTLKAGPNCFLAEVPAAPSGDVTFRLTQDAEGNPERLQDISNATFYSCEGEDPPTANVVKVTCDFITIETANIPAGTELAVTVTFADGSTELYTPTVDEDGLATVGLPGDVDPIWVRIEYLGMIPFDAGVMAKDAPCGLQPAVVDFKVTCDRITIETENIDPGSTLNVTVTFADDTVLTFLPDVDADGVAVVDLPGDRDPARLVVTFEETEIFDMFVEAVDAPCVKPRPKKKKRKRKRKRKRTEKTRTRRKKDEKKKADDRSCGKKDD